MTDAFSFLGPLFIILGISSFLYAFRTFFDSIDLNEPSPRQRLAMWSERYRDMEEHWRRELQMRAQTVKLSQETAAAAREAFEKLAAPAQEPEHWSEVRRSQSGPFTLKE